jgi:hypothetical protein
MKKRDDEAFCFMKYTRQDDSRIKVRNEIRIDNLLYVFYKGINNSIRTI